MQFSLFDLRIKEPPNHTRDVFACGNLTGELGNFVIQKAVVHALHHFAFKNLFQIFQVQHHSGDRIGFSGDGYLKSIVVPVAVRIIAFPEDAAIFFRREIWIVVKVRGGELDFAREQDHGVWCVCFTLARREE